MLIYLVSGKKWSVCRQVGGYKCSHPTSNTILCRRVVRVIIPGLLPPTISDWLTLDVVLDLLCLGLINKVDVDISTGWVYNSVVVSSVIDALLSVKG